MTEPAGDEPAPAGAPDALDGEPVSDQAPRRKRGRPSKAQIEADRTAAEVAQQIAQAAVAGATIAYTVAGGAVEVVGFQTAGFVMQAQAEQAGAALAEKSKGTRFYGWFAKAGQGGTMAPFIAGPILAEAYVRMPLQRRRILPMLGLLVPEQALGMIVEVYPVPDVPAEPVAAEPTAATPMANGVPPEDEATRAARAAAEWPETAPERG